ncbi:hypothetical protein SAMN05444360_104110 [Chryseobacterium carnipullorum]|nr:hypothetical protein SAMN05444360_104110 [Chryseobacterium carnipullorum]
MKKTFLFGLVFIALSSCSNQADDLNVKNTQMSEENQISSYMNTEGQKINNLSVRFPGYNEVHVKPSQADPSVYQWDHDHIVYYDGAIKNNKVLLWLTGTGGTTRNVPAEFFKTALNQGYRIVALSFITDPGVSQICIGPKLDVDVNCAAKFRRQRIYGDTSFPDIPDQYQDAIIPRLIKLFKYLSINDPGGQWSQYLNQSTGRPAWSKIAVGGQSQGGGMAEFIAKNASVARVISFSGGWDYSNSRTKQIAGWYSQQFVTPLSNIYAAYHVKEIASQQLAAKCKAMRIPSGNLFVGNQNVSSTNINYSNPYHVESLSNPVYKASWIKMLGSGR